jgi:steroid delta-isomerase-like uncharacterized protein
MMTENNKAIARLLIEEVFNRGNMAVADKIIAPDFVHHDPNTKEFRSGPDGFKHFLQRYREAFPDLHITVEQQIAEGDLVVDRWTGTGTHRGELMGIAATGKPVTLSGMSIHRIVGGKITETWNNYDALTLLEQLGFLRSHTL